MSFKCIHTINQVIFDYAYQYQKFSSERDNCLIGQEKIKWARITGGIWIEVLAEGNTALQRPTWWSSDHTYWLLQRWSRHQFGRRNRVTKLSNEDEDVSLCPINFWEGDPMNPDRKRRGRCRSLWRHVTLRLWLASTGFWIFSSMKVHDSPYKL